MSEKKNVNIKIKPIAEHQKSVDSFDNREKRLGIIFKVIYVMSFFWLVFVAVLFSTKKGNLLANNPAGVMAAMLAACITIIIISLVRYIYNELKCLKIDEKSKIKDQLCRTEYSYDRIFKDAKIGFGVGITLLAIHELESYIFHSVLSSEMIIGIFGVSFLLYCVCLSLKKTGWLVYAEDILCTVCFYSFYIYMIM